MTKTRLTDQFLKSDKCSTDKSHAIFSDGGNLYLDVTRSGAKSWMFIWFDKDAGKQRNMGLGSYTGAGRAFSVSLKQARELAEDCRSMLRRGVNPLEQKIAAKIGATTFADMLAKTIEKTKPSWKLKNGVYAQQIDWEAKIANHAAHLLPMAVGRVNETVIEGVLAPIWHTDADLADRLRVILKLVMQTAISGKHYTGLNPAEKATVEGALGRLVKDAQENHPALPAAKLPAAIATLLADARMTAKASVFCTLTTTRSDEARLIRWSEIDFATNLWTVPAARMKTSKKDRGGDHLVPLSDAAIALLRSISPVVGNDYVFAGAKAAQPVSKGSLNVVIAKSKKDGGILELAGEATQHGMRAVFSTWANEAGFNSDAIELQLAHVIGSKSKRAYDRAERIEQRAAILQAWGNFATGVSNVVALKVAA